LLKRKEELERLLLNLHNSSGMGGEGDSAQDSEGTHAVGC